MECFISHMFSASVTSSALATVGLGAIGAEQS